MSRVEELTLRLVDGEITDAELAELERLVREDPAAAARHVSMVDLEGQLRSQGRDPELAARAIERIRESARLRRGVMARIRAHPRSGRRWAWFGAAAAALVAVAALVGYGTRKTFEPVAVHPAPERPRPPEPPKERPVPEPERKPLPPEPPREVPRPPDPPRREPPRPEPQPPPPPPSPAPAPPPTPKPPPERTVPAVAALAAFEGDVRVAERPVQAGRPILEGEGVVSVGLLSYARVEFAEGPVLELGGQTSVREFSKDRRVSVECGTVTARAPKGAEATLRTAHAEVRAADAEVRLLVAPGESTRVETLRGKATLARDGRSVEVAAGSVGLALPGTPLSVQRVQAGLPPPDPRRVEEAIRRGVAYLKAARAGTATVTGLEKPMNTDELEVWTFLHAGVPEIDPKFQEDLERVMKTPLERTYKVALRAMILEELDRVKHQDRIAQCAQFLVDNQAKDGQWSYGEPSEFADEMPVAPHVATPAAAPAFVPAAPGRGRIKPKVAKTVAVRKRKDGPAGGDLSNSQYAALGLRACAEAGIAIPTDVLQRAVRSWTRAQHVEPRSALPAGGWCYDEDDDHAPYGSMTAGAVGALVIYDKLLGRNAWKRDPSIQAGLNWLSKHFSVTENPATPGSPASSRAARGTFYYYHLYALERVGGLCGLERIGPHEWYPLGARAILDAQQPDGSWTHASKYSQPPWETCFAILFLRRPTPPVASVDRFQQGK